MAKQTKPTERKKFEEPEIKPGELPPEFPPREQRQHSASYARDRRNGGYMVRVMGPKANMFAGKWVPVTTRAGDEHAEKTHTLVYTGTDDETGKPIALYTMCAKPENEMNDAIPF